MLVCVCVFLWVLPSIFSIIIQVPVKRLAVGYQAVIYAT